MYDNPIITGKHKMTSSTLLFLFTLGFCQLHDPALEGTKWKLQVTPECIDTLKLALKKSSYYSCEMGYTTDIKYFISGDTLFLDEYDYISNIDTGKQVSSKWKLLIKKDKLKPIYIAHKYLESYKEVDPRIYENLGEFNRVK
jgi:hypothetical protein